MTAHPAAAVSATQPLLVPFTFWHAAHFLQVKPSLYSRGVAWQLLNATHAVAPALGIYPAGHDAQAPAAG